MRHAMKRSPGINRKSRVLYPGPEFLSSATWPLMPKKHYIYWINHLYRLIGMGMHRLPAVSTFVIKDRLIIPNCVYEQLNNLNLFSELLLEKSIIAYSLRRTHPSYTCIDR